ncbi:MAG TPA: DUF5947 family protein [Rhizomicrobium sp.]|jgi:hypothetical protein|nr:DUF5947 family protein [Rhizomicrobium sp.]
MGNGYSGIQKLRKFVTGPVERCDFCRKKLSGEHPHLVEAGTLRLMCACAQCSHEMCEDDLGYRQVRRHQEVLEGFALADSDWAMLQIPIDVAFLFRPEGNAEPMALFPGPAGATHSQLSTEAWAILAERYPLLDQLDPGTEALLVNRSNGRRDHYRVSTDHCYALTGLLRTRWRGLNGGEEAWSAIDGYFAELTKASPAGEVHA